MRQLHDPTFAVGISLVHAIQKVAERVVGVIGVVLVHSVDRVGDPGDGQSLFPHLGNPLIRERSVLATLLALEQLRFRLASAI